ncbi:DUF7519 family protein [Halalkalirubrum salinum]|uniref:DUF7519 family protein n=1 Tax=Halalkalirubrum salinum TaxID=2563889 RepID=UPI0010FB7B63|nr:hypothetical protein [Halalkalirubrum salinum]
MSTERPDDELVDGEIDRTPSPRSAIGAVVLAAIATAMLALVSIEGAALAFTGAIVLSVGVRFGRLRIVHAGSLLSVGGLVTAGVTGATPEPLLVAAVCAVLAWDLAETAIELGDRVGGDASTARFESVHAAMILAVGIASAAVGYGLYAATAGGQPTTAVVLLLFGAVIVVSAFR